ncbi:MAG: hypothetical protein RLZZ385_1938 [Pseudomonadota bacterium]
MGVTHEAVPGKDHQGAAHHQQAVASLQFVDDRLHPLPRHPITEKHHMGLENATTVFTVGNHHLLHQHIGHIGISIGRQVALFL